jgi:hypothetical protein
MRTARVHRRLAVAARERELRPCLRVEAGEEALVDTLGLITIIMMQERLLGPARAHV